MFPRICSLLAVAGVSFSLCSCGPEERSTGIEEVPTYPVQGEVFLNGEPAAGVTAVLHLQNPPTPAPGEPGVPPQIYGSVDEQGKVHFRTYEEGDGAPVGEYAVTFQWKPARPGGINLGGRGGEARSQPDKLGGKYIDPDDSEYSLTVTAGAANNLGRIELEADLEAIQSEIEAGKPEITVPE